MCEDNDCYIRDFTDDIHPVMYLLREVGVYYPSDREFTREMEEAIERLIGRSLTSEEWFQCFFPRDNILPSIPFLRYLFQNNRIEWNQAYPENLLIRLASKKPDNSVKEMDRFLIEEIGMDIHTQCVWSGETILLSMLRKINSYEKLDLSRIKYYLENGADPLQENKLGLSALTYAQTYMTPYPYVLIELLERYA